MSPAALSPRRSPIGRQGNAYCTLSLATCPVEDVPLATVIGCASAPLATPTSCSWHSSRAHVDSSMLKGVWGVFCDTIEGRPCRGYDGASASK
jgi:hypothetical protein